MNDDPYFIPPPTHDDHLQNLAEIERLRARIAQLEGAEAAMRERAAKITECECRSVYGFSACNWGESCALVKATAIRALPTTATGYV